MDTLPNSGPTQTAPDSAVQPQMTLFQKYGPLAAQFLRFGLVGVVNTGIDFAVFNILLSITNVTAGAGIIPIKAAAFMAATTNSYLLNKKWTFKDNSSGEGAKKFSIYLSVSIIGALLNIGIVYLITTYIDPLFGASDRIWANAANLAATGVSLIWNFIGYKVIVFRGK